MKLLLIVVRIMVFLLLFGLALANTQESQLNIFTQTTWRAPMIVIGLAFFIAGLGASLLFTIPARMRLRLQIAVLTRRLKQQGKQQDKDQAASLNDSKKFS